MSDIPIEILTYKDREPIPAVLRTELMPSVLAEVEKEWRPLRIGASRKIYKEGRVNEVPSHWHWNWEDKSKKLELIAYRCFGIECDEKMQGLLLVQTAGKYARLDPDTGKELVYIDYLESAPWNVKPLVEEPQYAGIGAVLIRTAVQLSYEEGFHGRLGLHALKQAENFYRKKCCMRECGADANYHDLPYFEMTREIAAQFTSNLDGGVK